MHQSWSSVILAVVLLAVTSTANGGWLDSAREAAATLAATAAKAGSAASAAGAAAAVAAAAEEGDQVKRTMEKKAAKLADSAASAAGASSAAAAAAAEEAAATLASVATAMKSRMHRKPSAAVLGLLDHGDYVLGTRCEFQGFNKFGTAAYEAFARKTIEGAPPPYRAVDTKCASREAVTPFSSSEYDGLLSFGDAHGEHYGESQKTLTFAMNVTVPALANASFADPTSECYPFGCGGHYSFTLLAGKKKIPIPGWSLPTLSSEHLFVGMSVVVDLRANGTLGEEGSTNSLNVGIAACANIFKKLDLGCTPALPILALSGTGTAPLSKIEKLDLVRFTGSVANFTEKVQKLAAAATPASEMVGVLQAINKLTEHDSTNVVQDGSVSPTTTTSRTSSRPAEGEEGEDAGAVDSAQAAAANAGLEKFLSSNNMNDKYFALLTA